MQKRAHPYITYEDRNRSQQTVKGLRMCRSVRPVFQQPHPFPIVPHLLLDLRISPLESENLVVRAVRGFGREGGPYSQVTAAPRSAAALHGWSAMPANAKPNPALLDGEHFESCPAKIVEESVRSSLYQLS